MRIGFVGTNYYNVQRNNNMQRNTTTPSFGMAVKVTSDSLGALKNYYADCIGREVQRAEGTGKDGSRGINNIGKVSERDIRDICEGARDMFFSTNSIDTDYKIVLGASYSERNKETGMITTTTLLPVLDENGNCMKDGQGRRILVEMNNPSLKGPGHSFSPVKTFDDSDPYLKGIEGPIFDSDGNKIYWYDKKPVDPKFRKYDSVKAGGPALVALCYKRGTDFKEPIESTAEGAPYYMFEPLNNTQNPKIKFDALLKRIKGDVTGQQKEMSQEEAREQSRLAADITRQAKQDQANSARAARIQKTVTAGGQAEKRINSAVDGYSALGRS